MKDFTPAQKKVYKIVAPATNFYVDPYLVETGMYKTLEEAHEDEARSQLVLAHHDPEFADYLLKKGYIEKND